MCNLGEGIREKAEKSAEIRTKAQSIIDLMDSMGIDIYLKIPERNELVQISVKYPILRQRLIYYLKNDKL